ncbi:hypothetical protein BDQ12DRAFT_670734 [Crucibulum laeve]|uniref:Uncharacterized protein n=1 Tax=Crucibulum laeve TaxID=68775 RepID=A0A5C3LVU6_9AGAR|nr:hypothetical protein BDQ12DRAFT_670734 [Crucibulum laeve]
MEGGGSHLMSPPRIYYAGGARADRRIYSIDALFLSPKKFIFADKDVLGTQSSVVYDSGSRSHDPQSSVRSRMMARMVTSVGVTDTYSMILPRSGHGIENEHGEKKGRRVCGEKRGCEGSMRRREAGWRCKYENNELEIVSGSRIAVIKIITLSSRGRAGRK